MDNTGPKATRVIQNLYNESLFFFYLALQFLVFYFFQRLLPLTGRFT